MKLGRKFNSLKIEEGSSEQLQLDADFDMDLSVFLRTHTLMQGMTGSGKTNIILKIVEECEKAKVDVQMIFLDDQEEFTEIPNHFKDFSMISSNTPKSFSIDVRKVNDEDVCIARITGKQVRLLGKSVVVNLQHFKDKSDRKKFVGEFLIGLESVGKRVGKHAIVFIDEADQYVPSKERLHSISTEPIIDLTKRARKQNVSMVLSTQYMTEVDIRARRECHNRILGKVTELRDSRTCAELLGNSGLKDEFFDLETGEFFVRGDAFPKGVSRIFVDKSVITVKQAGVEMEQIATKSGDEIEKAIDDNNELPREEYLEMQIQYLKKQLDEEKIKTKLAFEEGYTMCENKWKNKNVLERLIK